MVMYKFDMKEGEAGGGSKNRSLGQTLYFYYFQFFFLLYPRFLDPFL